MEPTPGGGFTSVLIDDLNLEVDRSGRIISVWGMCPHTRWKAATLVPSPADEGVLFLIPDRVLLPGVSERIKSDMYLRQTLIGSLAGSESKVSRLQPWR
jgi:hypothetical protein